MGLSEKEREGIVRRIVAEVAARTLVDSSSAPIESGATTSRGRPVVLASEVRALPIGSTLRVALGSVVTPLAQDVALERRIRIVVEEPTPTTLPELAGIPLGSRIAVGADHAGFRLKEALRGWLEAAGYAVRDLGTSSEEAVDYPDFALAVAAAVASGDCAAGVVADGAGVGSAIAANKVRGVRAAPCPDAATARNAREHNFANVLCLPARAIDEARAREVLEAFVRTPTGEARHARRVAKIEAYERRPRAGPL